MDWFKNPSAVHYAGILNLIASVLVVLPAAFILWRSSARLFQQYRFTYYAFVFWTLQWFVAICVWAVYRSNGSQSIAVLAVVDLFVVSTVGFFWAYQKAETFELETAAKKLALLYGCLLLWNVVIGSFADDQERLRQLWILPSETVSVLGMAMVAVTFWQRYGIRALPLSGIVIPVYAFLQRPTYSSLFLEKVPDDAIWMFALAAAKLMYGLVFYTLFFSPAEQYAPVTLQLPSFPASKTLKWAGGTVGAVFLSALGTELAHFIVNHILKL
jgi:hypothetical protein